MKDINLMALDLELNKPSGSIIQIGAVVGNLKTGEILEEYLCHINVGEPIDPFITKLTGIRQEDVDRGYSLKTSYQQLIEMHKRYDCFRNCLTWGGGDSIELRKQLNLDNERFLFGRRWLDAKTLFISYRFSKGLSHQAGLAKALVKMGMKFEGKKHQACDDALNTFRIYRNLLKEFHTYTNTEDVIDE